MNKYAAVQDQHRSAQSRVAEYLRQEIRSGRMAGGTPVVAAPIAEHLGVSRMPVREAIQQLANDGFVTIRSNRSAVVTEFGPGDIADLYEMRAALEGYAMRHVAQNIDARGIQEAELALMRLDQAREDVNWFVSAHDIYHDALLAYCPRAQMVEEIRRIRHVTEPYLRLNLRAGLTAFANTTDEHSELLDAVRSGEPDRAEDEMRRHILRFDVREIFPA
ncbi:GntR family transcriptional regulator [uncultured Marivita sp.]|uniref:GntR family transcriptional regulator n=1 Tax=uncultured Marivita sp. TaxID=888080 RepID=UPI00262B7B88|nr:GntR family transcriptional regulator [uncultured Marivita sp.]